MAAIKAEIINGLSKLTFGHLIYILTLIRELLKE